jgi:hypothetical protein
MVGLVYFTRLISNNNPATKNTSPTGISTNGNQLYIGIVEPNRISASIPFEASEFITTIVAVLSRLLGLQ